jgi:hypothetical protein
MEKRYYNIDKIIRIDVIHVPIKNVKYHPAKVVNNLFTLYKDKYVPEYWEGVKKDYTREEILEKGFQIDPFNVVYDFPEVKIFMENDFKYTINFTTIKEAEDWLEKLLGDNDIKCKYNEFGR